MWKSKILRGVSTFSGIWVLRLLVGLGVSILMYRHFGPHAMGILAIATSVLGVVSFVVIEADVVTVTRVSGVGSPEGVKRVVAASYVIKVFNKLAVATVLATSASFIESFYRIDGLATLVLILAAGNLVSIGYGPIAPEILQGLLKYRELFLQSAIPMVNQIAAIGLTMWFRTGLVEYLIYTVLLDGAANVYGWYLYLKLRGQYGWSGVKFSVVDLAREVLSLVRTSIPVSLNQLLYKSYLYVGNLFAGKWYDPTVVGYLSFVSNIVNKVNSAGHGTFSIVFLPVFSELKQKEGSDLRDLYERGYHTMLIVTAAVTSFLTLFAKEVTLVIGGPSFLPAVILLQLLTIQLIFRIPLQILRMIYFAFEKTWTLFGVFALKTGSEIGLLFLLTLWLDEKGIVLAQVASYVVYAVSFAFVGFKFLYPDTYKGRAYEFARDLIFLLAIATGLIALGVSVAPTFLLKLAVAAAFLSIGAVWVRAGQMAGRRVYLVGR